jgi:hypothetical protein
MSNAFASADSGGFNNETWLTPPGILAALGEFDCDPCAAPTPRPWPTAKRHIELPEDGLRADWNGRVWCNPPYGAEAKNWLAKLAAHGDGIALVFARTETGMFFTEVWPKAHGILFLKGRIAFCDRNGKPAQSAGAPSCLIAYGTSNADVLRNCTLGGHFIELVPMAAAQDCLFAA